MANVLQHTLELIELWARRQAPDPADAARILTLAQHVEEEHKSTQSIQALSWRLTEELSRKLGQRLAADLALCRCRSAAASISHCSRELLEQICGHIGASVKPLFLLGSLGASRTLLDAWDLLPGGSAVLVPQHNSEHLKIDMATSARCLPRGMSWANPGRLLAYLAEGARRAPINGGSVLVPAPEIFVALSAPLVIQQSSTDSLTFCAAAYQSVAAGTWQRAEEIAQALGHGGAPLQAALQLKIEGWLGLQVPPTRRVTMAVRRLLAHEGHG